MRIDAFALKCVCILLCLSLNYTFPLHRQNVKLSTNGDTGYTNNSWHWDDLLHNDIIERSKKMANNIGNAIKKIKYSAQDIGRNTYLEKRKENDKLSEEDLRQYELSVIMKKYPYLDIKELEYQYSPISNKNIRQSWRYESESNLRDSVLYEPDEINVEIINRGLSGFSIPPKLSKAISIVDNQLKINKETNNEQQLGNLEKLYKKSSNTSLGSLGREIRDFELKKRII